MAKSRQPDPAWRLMRLKFTDAERALIRRMLAVPKRVPLPTPQMTQQPLFGALPAMTSRRDRRRRLEVEHRTAPR